MLTAKIAIYAIKDCKKSIFDGALLPADSGLYAAIGAYVSRQTGELIRSGAEPDKIIVEIDAPEHPVAAGLPRTGHGG